METNKDKQYGHPAFYKLLEKMAQIHSDKNHDYAGVNDPLYNFKVVNQMGIEPWIGVAVRMCDKFTRLENFVKQKELHVKDENIEDTLIDLANYSLICILLRREASIKPSRLTATEAIAAKMPPPETSVIDPKAIAKKWGQQNFGFVEDAHAQD